MVLDTGEPVPQVTATNQDGDRVTVDFVAPTVLYFYPRDDTPGCTTEATQFDAELDAYREAGVAVYGVSTDDADSHRTFADAHDLDVELLADPDGKIADAFGVDTTDGAATRTTFVCARRQVCGLYERVHPDGHARNVLFDILDIGLATLPE
ncbi:MULTISPECIES: peroxiredoxin [Salinibaculum]|uniref:peroxiredoxin n=1 Tax=Salinibaculum TaxID=2732368 RepID=UPI0030D1E456